MLFYWVTNQCKITINITTRMLSDICVFQYYNHWFLSGGWEFFVDILIQQQQKCWYIPKISQISTSQLSSLQNFTNFNNTKSCRNLSTWVIHNISLLYLILTQLGNAKLIYHYEIIRWSFIGPNVKCPSKCVYQYNF